MRDKLVLLRHLNSLKRAEPYSGEKLESHIKDYYIIYYIISKVESHISDGCKYFRAFRAGTKSYPA